MAAMSAMMSRSEREDLQRLIRQREKVQVAAAKQRSADLMADFANQMAAIYRPADDPVWRQAEAEASREIAKAQKRIAARCNELGIPEGCQPSLGVHWNHRGYENAAKRRRDELAAAAKAQIEALERQAIVRIQQASVEAQTELALAGLTSDAAHVFVARLPTVESLMPSLSFQELAGEAEPPIAEQLITPNALRQRRYRERQKALRPRDGDAGITSQVALPEGDPEP
jgi:hypothetical protein